MKYFPASYSLFGEKKIITPGNFSYDTLEEAIESARTFHGQYQAVVESTEDGHASENVVWSQRSRRK